MSGASLAALLETLGFAVPLEGSSLSWAFEQSPSCAALLNHLVRVLGPANALTAREAAFLEAHRGTLASKGKSGHAHSLPQSSASAASASSRGRPQAAPWLKGAALDQALASLQRDPTLAGPTSSGPLDTRAYDGQREAELKRRLASWVARRDVLTAASLERAQAVTDAQRAAKQESEAVRESLAALAKADKDLAAQLGDLGLWADRAGLLSPAPSSQATGPAHLGLLDPAAYFEQDKAFVRDLSALFDAHFRAAEEEGAADGETDGEAGRAPGDGSRLELSQGFVVVDPRGRDEAFRAESAELNRLGTATALARAALAREATRHAGARAAARAAEAQAAKDAQYRSMPLKAIRSTIDDVSARISKARAVLSEARTKLLPALLASLAEAELAPVLLGDCTLKLARQRAHIARQDAVISALAEQRARHAVILHQLALEDRERKAAHGIVSSALRDVSLLADAARPRVLALEQLAVPAPPPRRTLDDRDVFLTSMFDLVAPGRDPRSIILAESLVAAAARPGAARTAAAARLSEQRAKSEEMGEALVRAAATIKEVVYKEGAGEKEIAISVPEVTEAQRSLDTQTQGSLIHS